MFSERIGPGSDLNPSSPPVKTGREYPDRPIVGVGGLLFQGRSALLIKRGKPPGQGQWSIPGGAVKVGETLTEGLAREMVEEVGLNVTVGPLVEVVERIFLDDNGRALYHYVLMDYLCFPREGALNPGSDAAEARYVPPEEWPEYHLPAITIQVLHKALEMVMSRA